MSSVVSSDRLSAGASTTRLSSISAAGWTSHVGYQNDRISRFVWKREPAPPSKPSYEGACRNSVFMNALEENSPRGRDQSPARTRQVSAMFAKCFEAFKKMTMTGKVLWTSLSPVGPRKLACRDSPHDHIFGAARQLTRSIGAAAIAGEQDAD